jgi:hypothetical protein
VLSSFASSKLLVTTRITYEGPERRPTKGYEGIGCLPLDRIFLYCVCGYMSLERKFSVFLFSAGFAVLFGLHVLRALITPFRKDVTAYFLNWKTFLIKQRLERITQRHTHTVHTFQLNNSSSTIVRQKPTRSHENEHLRASCSD